MGNKGLNRALALMHSVERGYSNRKAVRGLRSALGFNAVTMWCADRAMRRVCKCNKDKPLSELVYGAENYAYELYSFNQCYFPGSLVAVLERAYFILQVKGF